VVPTKKETLPQRIKRQNRCQKEKEKKLVAAIAAQAASAEKETAVCYTTQTATQN
jgi:hypothetical protein